MTTLALSHPPRYLTDRFQGTLARDLALVLAGAAVITASALITIPLPFTPVPITLATLGYVLAAFIAGQLARRRADRRPVTTVALAALGTLVLYLCGGAWLAVSLGLDLRQTFLLGVAPFLLGDALKALALTVLLPSV